MALRLLRLAGAPIETQYGKISEAQGSSLWLEDFLEEIEIHSPSTINRLLTIFVYEEGKIFWQTETEDTTGMSELQVTEYLQKYVIESGISFSNFITTVKKGDNVTNNYGPVSNVRNQNNANDYANQSAGDHSSSTQTQDNREIVSSGLNDKFFDISEQLDAISKEIKANSNLDLMAKEIERLKSQLETLRGADYAAKKGFFQQLAAMISELTKMVGTVSPVYKNIKPLATFCWPIFEAVLKEHSADTLDSLKHILK